MRIALVAEWLDSWRGGAETSTQEFLRHLMQRGVEVHAFTRSRPSPMPGLHVHHISGASMSRLRQSMTFGRRVRQRLHEDRFDVVHAISPCLGVDVYQPRGGTLAETVRRNLAMRRSGSSRSLKRCANQFNLKQRYLLLLERRLCGTPDGPIVVAISRYVRSQLVEHYGVSEDRVRVIYNGVDGDTSTDAERQRHREAVRKEFCIGRDDRLILSVAHNFRLKGVRRWMEAFQLLMRHGARNVRALVVGKGDTPRWHHLAARMGLREHLTFTGPSDRVAMFLHAADVLVHPTYYDPCSRVVLEGMAAGLPCVTTKWDGASEMIADGENGFVLDDPWDVGALAGRVEKLLEDGLREKVGAEAQRVSDRITMSRHAEEMLSLYETIVSRRGRTMAPLGRGK